MKVFTFKNIFTLICSTLTLALIYQVLFTFEVTRPTTTSKEEKELEISDLPEVVVCLDPGLNITSLMSYGYRGRYAFGQMNNRTFVGWNGRKNVSFNKSSRDILEEAFLVPDSWRSNKTQLIKKAIYVDTRIPERYSELADSELAPMILSYPLGRCLSISPPHQKDADKRKLNKLFVRFNDTAFKALNISFEHVKIFFMDKTNSPKLYPNELEMAGTSIKMRQEIEFQNFKIKI